MDGWMNGWGDEWMGGLIDGWINGKEMERWVNELMGG